MLSTIISILFWILWLAAMLKYLGRPRVLTPISYRTLAIFVIGVRFLSAGIFTFLQYETWRGNELSKLFLPPTRSWNYFILYTFTHFWLSALITCAIAAVWFLFLHQLQKYNPRFFDEGEVELGALLALIVGWPSFVVFLIFIFLFILFFSVFRILFMKEKFTTMGLPFLLASVSAIIMGSRIIELLGWSAIRA